MSNLVCLGATLKCSCGETPSSLVVLPLNRVTTSTVCANIMDHVPMVNIMPFGACLSMANPIVAAATAAAFGVLKPMPCIPVTPAPWAPGCRTVLIGRMPALDNLSKLTCSHGGVIRITGAGQQTIVIPDGG